MSVDAEIHYSALAEKIVSILREAKTCLIPIREASPSVCAKTIFLRRVCSFCSGNRTSKVTLNQRLPFPWFDSSIFLYAPLFSFSVFFDSLTGARATNLEPSRVNIGIFRGEIVALRALIFPYTWSSFPLHPSNSLLRASKRSISLESIRVVVAWRLHLPVPGISCSVQPVMDLHGAAPGGLGIVIAWLGVIDRVSIFLILPKKSIIARQKGSPDVDLSYTVLCDSLR